MNQGQGQPGILAQLATTIKGNRLESVVKIPRRLIEPSGGHQNCRRCRTITYPGVIPYNLQHSGDYVIEMSVQCAGRSILVERWKLTLRDCKNPEKTSSNELNLNLFFQALKSTLHFSTITAILKQNIKDLKIQSREFVGSFGICGVFEMDTVVHSLPLSPVDCDSELICSVESIPRSSVPTILTRLTTLPVLLPVPVSSSFKSTFYNSTSGSTSGSTSNTHLPIGFSRPRYKSVSSGNSMESSMDDSGCFDVDSLADGSVYKSDEVFSPPSKIVRHGTLPVSRRAISHSIPTLRNLLTSPPIERQLKYASSSTSIRLPFSFPTIRKNISRSLLGTFEESILHSRLRCVGILNGFTLDIGALGSFCPPHLKKTIVVRHFATDDDTAVALPSPYLGVLKFGKDGRRGYQIPKCGNLQLTLFNPEGSVVRVFSIPYDFSDMPPASRTFLRQKTVFKENQKMRYLIHLRVMSSSRKAKMYLHGEVKIIFSNTYRMQTLTEEECIISLEGPTPKYSTHCSGKSPRRISPEVEKVRKNLSFRDISPESISS